MEAYPRAYVPRNEPNLGPDEENLYRGERRRSPQSERFNEQQSEDDHDDNVSYPQENQDRLSSRGESSRADIDSLSGLSGQKYVIDLSNHGGRLLLSPPADFKAQRWPTSPYSGWPRPLPSQGSIHTFTSFYRKAISSEEFAASEKCHEEKKYQELLSVTLVYILENTLAKDLYFEDVDSRF
ncbi:hypothetical protein L207DRAFT_523699 [Hyaloscypha variabilis F]|uniref:Uncharacterized protein n=1 Tax=Hyaloscypha variabilis (strain UAMH 11265 / GT02V1 / F) TaxID=1149755 RepID=A0A2J6S6A7_HYAVF|nr:hypothetical protein L207DRAFT_523699 [Hyaloscypha variabilis F]